MLSYIQIYIFWKLVFWKINIDYKWWHNLSIDVCQLFFLTYLYIIWGSMDVLNFILKA